MKHKSIITLACTAFLISWQHRIITKKVAAASGAFNDWITVCISYNETDSANNTADHALRNAGAHFKYERLIPFSGGTKKQVCYVKLKNNPKKEGYLARYLCSGTFGSHADSHFESLDLTPCNIYFNNNMALRGEFEKIDKNAREAKDVTNAIEKMKK